jgi:hypothetical protein
VTYLDDALKGLLFAPKVTWSQASTAHGIHLISLDCRYTFSPFPHQALLFKQITPSTKIFTCVITLPPLKIPDMDIALFLK